MTEVLIFVSGGFLNVASLGWSSDMQVAVWVVAVMVGMSVLNLSGAFPVIPVTPRSPNGIVGVAAAPFQHGSPLHLAGNAFGVIVMAYVLAVSNPGFWPVAAAVTVISGSAYWMIGPSGGAAVGASDAIFGMWAYWMVHQWLPLDPDKIAYLGVMFLVSSVSIWKAFAPTNGSRVSHLIGALVGGMAAAYGF